jgi:hypothetical protein
MEKVTAFVLAYKKEIVLLVVGFVLGAVIL